MLAYKPAFHRHGSSMPRFSQHQVRTTPDINVIRKENGYEIQMAVPGLRREDISIDIADNSLTVKSQIDKKDAKPDYTRHEFELSSFEKSFRLPDNSDIKAIEATCKEGILTILIPDQAIETRTITIQ